MNFSYKISVVLPFYNAQKTLQRAVNSILNQSFNQFELILVNNNSTDKSPQIAQENASKDTRIKIINETRQGVVYASNTGFKIAQAPLIARMDADDEAHEHRLQAQYEFLQANIHLDAAGTMVNYCGDLQNKGLHKYVEYTNTIISEKDIADKRFTELLIINPTFMFRKKSLEKFGDYLTGDFPEDYELFLRWLSKGAVFGKVQKRLLNWHDSPQRLTRTDKIYSQKSFFELKAKYLSIFLQENNKYFPETVIWGAGRLTRRRAELNLKYGIKILYYIDIDPNKIDGKNVISHENIPPPGQIYILSYVNNHGAREKIRDYLKLKKYVEIRDFLFIS